MLHISKKEQGKRLQDRLDEPKSRWKFNPGDLDDRKLWKQYVDAYELMLDRCSTAWAPWHVIPADHKWARNAAIAAIVRETLEAMNPQYPKPTWNPKTIKVVLAALRFRTAVTATTTFAVASRRFGLEGHARTPHQIDRRHDQARAQHQPAGPDRGEIVEVERILQHAERRHIEDDADADRLRRECQRRDGDAERRAASTPAARPVSCGT